MNRLLLPLFGSVLVLALTGCGSMNFATYQGEQKPWPTGNAFNDGVFDVPLYRGWPEKPYDVLGFVRFRNPNVDWNRGDMKMAARLAKESGGDAMILMPKGDDPSPTTSSIRQQLGISPSQTVGVVVKWK